MISSAAMSGAERTVLELAEGFGAEVWTPGSGWLTEVVPRGVTVPMRGIGFFRTAVRLSRRRDVDVVHAHLTRGLRLAHLAARLGGPRVVGSVHIYNDGPIYRSLGRAPHRLIAVSEYVRANLVRQGTDPSRIVTIPNGTDLHLAPPTDRLATRRALGIAPDGYVVGVVGRIHPWKGQDLLVRALSGTGAVALLVGRVADRSALDAAIAASSGVRVIETGATEDVVPLLDAMDVLALPSERETFGLAAIEGMARGLPIVAHAVGALPEVVEDGVTGYVVAPPDLGAALQRVRGSDLGVAGRARVASRYSVAKMLEAHRAVYERES